MAGAFSFALFFPTEKRPRHFGFTEWAGSCLLLAVYALTLALCVALASMCQFLPPGVV
nr:MAG TPA: hypothetical protein [Caudoviricetes sp.]